MDKALVLYAACFRPDNYTGDYFSIDKFYGPVSNLNKLFSIEPPNNKNDAYIIEIKYGDGKPKTKPVAKWNGNEWIENKRLVNTNS